MPTVAVGEQQIKEEVKTESAVETKTSDQSPELEDEINAVNPIGQFPCSVTWNFLNTSSGLK